VAAWIGEGLLSSSKTEAAIDGYDKSPHVPGSSWPRAAAHVDGKTWDVAVSEWPRSPAGDNRHLVTVLDRYGSEPLSYRATRGFRDRLKRSNLRHTAEFMAALDEHVVLTGP
jgi:DNA (cytosine-5)-methyltransferase 1